LFAAGLDDCVHGLESPKVVAQSDSGNRGRGVYGSSRVVQAEICECAIALDTLEITAKSP
jgi:hypothetical protein